MTAARARRRTAWLLALAPFVSGTALGSELVDRIVAIIDREVITLSEAEQARSLAEARSGEVPSLAAIVERLIENRLVEREVERFSNDPVPLPLVEEAVAQVRSGFASEEAFQAMLSRNGLGEAELVAELRRQLAVSRHLERRFRALTYVTEEEIERYYREELLPAFTEATAPELSSELADQIRPILEERKFNERVEAWIGELKSRARIRRYVWDRP